MKPGMETSEDIARKLGLANIELEYTEEDFETLTNYKLFREHIQPLLAEQNLKSPQTKVVNLIAAKWREFAQAAGQYKKSKAGLVSPTEEKKEEFGAGDSKADTTVTPSKESVPTGKEFGTGVSKADSTVTPSKESDKSDRKMASIEVLKDIPGYKAILKTVLKSQIQGLLQQLSEHTGEESVIITAGVNDGSLSHLGSTLGKGFLDEKDEIKYQFLGYCLKALGQQQQQQQQQQSSSSNSSVSNPSLEHRPEKPHRPENPHVVTRPKPYDRVSSKNQTLQQRREKSSSSSDQKDANNDVDLSPLGFTRPKSPMPNEGTELSRLGNSPCTSSLSYDASDLSDAESERSVDSNATTVKQEMDNYMEYNEVGQGNAMSGNAETTNATTVKQEVNSDNGGNTTRPQHNNPVQASIRSPYQVYTNPNPDNSTSLNLDNISIKKGQGILEGGGEFEEGQAYFIRDNKGKATTRVWKNGDFVPAEKNYIGRQGTPKSTNQASSDTGETLDVDNFNKKNVILEGGGNLKKDGFM